MRVLERFFLSPEAAVFLPASFFSGALEAVAGALEAGFLSAALGGILKDVRSEKKTEKSMSVVELDVRERERVLRAKRAGGDGK